MPASQIISILTHPMVLAGAALCVLAVAAYGLAHAVARWRATRQLAPSDPPPLVIPVQRRGSVPPALFPMRFTREAATDPAAGAANGAAVGAAAPLGYASGVGPVYGQPSRPGNGNGTPSMTTPGMGTPSLGTSNVSGPASDSGNLAATPAGTRPNGAPPASKVVHTIPPMDGTLQFLPGRLEIVDGEAPGRDIRFVRTWGEVPEITFGRVSGPPYRHVQLRSQTVSRQHARMQYIEGRWKLTNLSQTNPVVINGLTLDSAHGQRVLRDGDQIEMGEVVFRFRER